MSYTEQHVQMARQVMDAVSRGDKRASILLGRIAERTGLTQWQCADEISAIAALPHPLDATASGLWGKAFRAATAGL